VGKKSNLMVFLRPVVLRDGRQADEFSQNRYQEMQTHQRAMQPAPNIAAPVNRGPMLPDLPPPKSSVLTLPPAGRAEPAPSGRSKLVVDPANSVTPAPSREPVALPPPQPALPTGPYGPGFQSRDSGTGASERYDPSLYVN
jgi:general secretion pathway protein D